MKERSGDECNGSVAKLAVMENKWASIIVSRLPKECILCLICSLLNTVTSYNPNGWGIP